MCCQSRECTAREEGSPSRSPHSVLGLWGAHAVQCGRKASSACLCGVRQVHGCPGLGKARPEAPSWRSRPAGEQWR